MAETEFYESSSWPHPATGAARQRVAGSAIIAGILAAVVVAALGFLGGVQYGKHHPATTTLRAGAAGRFTPGGFGARRNRVIGTVTAISATSITVNDQRSGSSKTYAIDNSTHITDNGAAVSYSTIATGDTVLVTAASGSSTIAARILVNPSFGGASASGANQATPQAVTN